MGDVARTDDVVFTSTGRVDGRSARKVETRRKVLQAAAALFAEQGFAGTSMDEIAAAAGVSKGTIFYNFRNKADIIEQLIASSATRIVQQLEAARVGNRGWDALSEAMWRVLRTADAFLPEAKILVDEIFRANREWSEQAARSRSAITEPLEAIIAELAEDRHQAGNAPTGIGMDHMANVGIALVGALVIAALDRRAFMPDRPLEEVHRGLMLALAGLRPSA